MNNIARNRQNDPELDFELRTRSAKAMGFSFLSYKPSSRILASAYAVGNGLALSTGTRIGDDSLIAVEVFGSASTELHLLLAHARMSFVTSDSVIYLFRGSQGIEPTRFVRGDQPFVTIHARDGSIPWGGNVEANGSLVEQRGIVPVRDLPILSAADLARLVQAVEAAGGERDEAPDEPPLVNPAWPLDVQVTTLAAMLRKALRRLDAIEADDEPAGADRPRRPHRRVNPLPGEVN